MASVAINLKLEDLQKELTNRFKSNRAAVMRAVGRGARRAQAALVERTPVDTGNAKNAWRVINNPETNTPQIYNDAPYIGVLEKGARPHKMSRAGIEALIEWVKRQGLSTIRGPLTPMQSVKFKGKEGKIRKKAEEQDIAESIAWAIAKKIEKEGQVGHFFVEKILPDVGKWVNEELERLLRESAPKKASP
jgi:hypothetical protein